MRRIAVSEHRLSMPYRRSGGHGLDPVSRDLGKPGRLGFEGCSARLPSPTSHGTCPASGGAYKTATNRLVAQTYDSAGNQETMGTYTLTYDAENRQTQVYDDSSGSTFT